MRVAQKACRADAAAGGVTPRQHGHKHAAKLFMTKTGKMTDLMMTRSSWRSHKRRLELQQWWLLHIAAKRHIAVTDTRL